MSTVFFFLLDQKIDLYSLIALFLVVWLIYTFDHLLDARKIKKNVILPRHRFHQKYFAFILLIWIITVLITAGFIFLKLSIGTIYTGITVFLFVITYFLLLQIKRFKKIIVSLKEISVAIIYTLGILAPIYNSNSAITNPAIMVIVQIFLLALINLWEFSFFETFEDQKQGQQSLATLIGKTRIKQLIYIVIGGNYSIIIYTLYSYPNMRIIWVELCFILMNSVLMAIMLYQPFFSKFERYRIVGDAIFYTPILLSFVHL